MTATQAIPLLDLRAQHAHIREEVLAEVMRVMDSQQFILGEDVALLEREIAEYCGTEHAVGCASGTDALILSLMALDIGPGDEVLTVPYTFFASAGAVVRVGAMPVFTDIDASTFQMDVSLVEDALRRHARVKAIIPVHLFGACVDMDPLVEMARRRGIAVVEDACQSIGAEYKGRRAGSLGDFGCFSFFPSKNLGGYGDGGVITTHSAPMAAKLKALRVHGSHTKYFHQWVGMNSRLDSLQAAVLRVKLRHLDVWTAARQRNAALYAEHFEASGASAELQATPPGTVRHVYNQFVIQTDRRDELKRHLAGQGIGTEIYYPLPLHLQECFEGLGYREGDFPASERLARRSLALPVYPELAAGDIRRVCEAAAEFERFC